MYYLNNIPLENKKQESKQCDTNVTPESVDTNEKTNKNSSVKQTKRENKGKSIEKAKRVSESEFVSDTLQTNPADLDEVKEGMKKLGIDSLAKQALETNKNGKKIKRVTNIY